jgi:hypothetical protein
VFRHLSALFRSNRRRDPNNVLKRACLQVESLVGEVLSGFRLRRPATVHAALVCEQLERRLMPAVCTWLGTAGNSLASNPANWLGGVAPAPGDSITFQNSNPNPCTIDERFPVEGRGDGEPGVDLQWADADQRHH